MELQEGLDAPKPMQQVIWLLLYVNDEVLFSYDVDGMRHLLGALTKISQSSGLRKPKCGWNKMMVVFDDHPTLVIL